MHHFPSGMLAVQRLSLQELLTWGAAGGFLVFLWSYLNWRRAVKTVFVVALLEGAIRKWVFPQGQELIYLLKDAILAGAYVRFYLAPDAEQRRYRLQAPKVAVAMAAIIVSLSALNPNIGSSVLALYGIKIYLYYIPLAFMMPFLFRSEPEMIRQLSWYALLAIPICLLGFLQYFAPVDSPLNVYAASGGIEIGVATFGESYEHARISGTFSYLSGLVTFLTVFFGLVMALLTMQEVRGWVRKVLLFGCIPLLAANSFMSGSRAAVLYGALIFLTFALATTFFSVGTSKGVLGIWLAMVGVVVIGGTFVFSSSMASWEARRKGTDDSVGSRLMMIVDGVNQASQQVDIAGYGIGMAHPAILNLRRILNIAPPRRPCPSFDSEVGQVYAELGLAGFVVWYLLRFGVLYACWRALAEAPPSPRKAIYLMCFIFQALSIVGSVVYNHTAAVFLWASYGLCLIPNLQTISRRVEPSSSARNRDPSAATRLREKPL